ncbi:MAG TPA: TonB family protein [Terriglobales bacterium]|nr:TonB family protein [Terriglobales bacterium]
MTIFSTLRAVIAGEPYDSAMVLGAIAEAAQALTGAKATALAMRREGLVICRARCGDTAPELGSRLSIDSGISGECLRTGKVLRCDDTSKDLRVDPLVCHRLGLRSIAAVPLRGRRGTMGVLEAFSTRPYAFAEEHMDYLIRLAELAEMARMRESGVFEAVVEPKRELPAPPTPEAARTSAAAGALLWAKDLLSVHMRARFDSRKAGLALGIIAIPLLLLLGFSGWNSRQKPPVTEAAKTVQPRTVAMTEAGPAASSAVVFKPSPVHASAASSRPPIQEAATREAEQPAAQTLASIPPAAPPAGEPSPPGTDAAAAPVAPPELPKLTNIPPDRSSLTALASVPVDMPAFGSPVSQGLSGGTLQHKVMPVYPLAAIPLRLSGTVVLDTTIDEKGNVADVKVVSGPPLLTAAAIDALRQWHYSPFLLNGKPVKMQKQVSIIFHEP